MDARNTGKRRLSTGFAALVALGLVSGLVACAADSDKKMSGSGNPSGASGAGAGIGGGASGTGSAATGGVAGTGVGTGDGGVCVGLQCQQASCPGGGSTTISGVVYDPAGKNPLYNVVVYVPNAPLSPLPQGASCDSCRDLFSGNPIAVASTDASGKFTLTDAPDGANIPLVLQVGKWRKQLTIANVARCQDNPQPDKSLTLPKSHLEGDIPNIAIATGGADTLECLLRRVGVDPAEYTPGAGGEGRIHIFQGNPTMVGIPGLFGGGGGLNVAPNTAPAAPQASAALWNTADELKKYDIVLLSCEGDEAVGMNQQALHDYASAGGRVFASHFHYSWFNSGPYAAENLATWTPGGNSIGDISGQIVTTLPSGDVFPKGQALFDWLSTVGALVNGELPIAEARHNADVAPTHTVSQSWIVAGPATSAPGATQYFSFNTPTMPVIGPDGPDYCGRVVYSDLHVGAASGDDPLQAVPGSCANADLSPQEKALEFMLFDLSSCVTPDDKPPAPPIGPE